MTNHNPTLYQLLKLFSVYPADISSTATPGSRYGYHLTTAIVAQPSVYIPLKPSIHRAIRVQQRVVMHACRSETPQANRAPPPERFSKKSRSNIQDFTCHAVGNWSSGDHLRISNDRDHNGVTRKVRDDKVSWKWASECMEAENTEGQFRHVVAQVPDYMKETGLHWDHVFTGREYVAIERGGRASGYIRVSFPVS
ncbi:hypothetical protein K440DRAFT_642765 [Wilcoxina mikolae CBS 423.85]|nr:hypothetical protein K440DRAFT_642765 [Wilcoxina mikolae CBS 423.85]